MGSHRSQAKKICEKKQLKMFVFYYHTKNIMALKNVNYGVPPHAARTQQHYQCLQRSEATMHSGNHNMAPSLWTYLKRFWYDSSQRFAASDPALLEILPVDVNVDRLHPRFHVGLLELPK